MSRLIRAPFIVAGLCVLALTALLAISLLPALAQAPASAGVVDAGGKLNYWLLAGLLGTVLVTNVGMVLLKKQFPQWERKAWAPPLLGLVTAVLGAMMAGQVTSFESLVAFVLAGVGSGAAASSMRDVAVGK